MTDDRPSVARLAEAARLHVLAALLGEGVELADAVQRVVHPDDEDEQRLNHARAEAVAEMLRRESECNDASGSDHP